MNQSKFWHDTIFDAADTSVQAAGGVKVVASKLWPTLDPASAQARLRGCLNPDRPEKFDLTELVMLGKLARAKGDNSLMEFLGRELTNEVKPIAATAARKKAKRAKLEASLAELIRLVREDDEE